MNKKTDSKTYLIKTIENLLNKGEYFIVTTNKRYLPNGIDIMARKTMPLDNIYVALFKIKKECETEQEALSRLDKAIEYEKNWLGQIIDGVLISPLKKDYKSPLKKYYKLTEFKRV